MLDARFSGLGDSANVSVERTAWGEYLVKDARFCVTFHTFLTHELTNADRFLAKQATCIRWLRDKLLADLDEGSKIFVYNSGETVTDP
jgi:hypothetical protein